MPVRCSIKECCSHTSMKDIYYFEFPFNNPKLLGKWLCRIKASNWFPSRDDYICSEHFCSYDLDFSNASYPKLKSDAVPIKFPRPQIKVLEELISDINKSGKKLDNDKPIIKKIIINGLSNNVKSSKCESDIKSNVVLDSQCGNIRNTDDIPVNQNEIVNGLYSGSAKDNDLENCSQKNISQRSGTAQDVQIVDSDKLASLENHTSKMLPKLSNKKLRLRIQIDKVANKIPRNNSLLNRENLQYFKSIGLEEKLSNKNVVFKIDLLGRKIKITQLQDSEPNRQDFLCKPETHIKTSSSKVQFSEINAAKEVEIINNKESSHSIVERILPSNCVRSEETRPGLDEEKPVKQIHHLDEVHTISGPRRRIDHGKSLQNDYIKKLIPVTAKRVQSLKNDKILRCTKSDSPKTNSKNFKSIKALAQKAINKSNIMLDSSMSPLTHQFKLFPIGSDEFPSYILIASPKTTK